MENRATVSAGCCVAMLTLHQNTKTAPLLSARCVSKRGLAEGKSPETNSLKGLHCVKSQTHLRGGHELNSPVVDERFGRKEVRGGNRKGGGRTRP